MKTIEEKDLTLKIVKEYLTYHRKGYFTWRKSPSKRIKKGSVAGYLDKYSGYYKLPFFGKDYRLHRLVFFYHNGRFPILIDHKDRNKTNNRISNLVETTKAGNARNSNITDRGVYIRKGNKNPYAATFNNGTDRYNLGCFPTVKQAAEAYDVAAVMILNERKNLNYPKKYRQYLIKAKTTVLRPSVYRNRIKRKVTVKDVREYFTYANGQLYWAKDYGSVKKGDLAGTTHNTNKERLVCIFEYKYYLRRLIWMYHYGKIKGNIEYIKGRSNDITNLRDTGI